MHTIDACVFAAFGTLFDPAGPVRRCARALAPIDPEDFAARWWSARKALAAARAAMAYDAPDDEDTSEPPEGSAAAHALAALDCGYWSLIARALDETLAAFGRDDPLLRARLMQAAMSPPPFPEIGETLEKLAAAGLRIALFSNAGRAMLWSAVRESGSPHLFNALFSTEDSILLKPHPAAYQPLVDGLKLPPQRIAYVSADPSDCSAADKFGFQTFWLQRLSAPSNSSSNSAGNRKEPLLPASITLLRNLRDLPGLVTPKARAKNP